MQRDRLLLAEVIDAVERLVELTAARTPADFEADRDRRDALLWNFTVLGEAVSQLSQQTKDAHPAVSWADPVRMRNRIVHGYWSLDLDILVTTARDDLPPRRRCRQRPSSLRCDHIRDASASTPKGGNCDPDHEH
jgi:uncharacterized protein with HEPN domain